MTDTDAARHALDRLLQEVLHGPPQGAAFVLNRGDRGLLRSLDGLSAEAASARPGGRASIAAHVDHLRYGFQLLNRWARGDDPWHDADYAASWRRQQVDDEQWRALRAALAGEAGAWAAAARPPRPWDQDGWANALASVVHLAYHLGAIRQIEPAAGGPPAND
jgi:hypothetical protein